MHTGTKAKCTSGLRQRFRYRLSVSFRCLSLPFTFLSPLFIAVLLAQIPKPAARTALPATETAARGELSIEISSNIIGTAGSASFATFVERIVSEVASVAGIDESRIVVDVARTSNSSTLLSVTVREALPFLALPLPLHQRLMPLLVVLPQVTFDILPCLQDCNEVTSPFAALATLGETPPLTCVFHCLRHCLCFVFPLPSRLRHCLSLWPPGNNLDDLEVHGAQANRLHINPRPRAPPPAPPHVGDIVEGAFTAFHSLTMPFTARSPPFIAAMLAQCRAVPIAVWFTWLRWSTATSRRKDTRNSLLASHHHTTCLDQRVVAVVAVVAAVAAVAVVAVVAVAVAVAVAVCSDDDI